MKYQFNGPVGQVFAGGDFGRVDTTITMGDDGEMTVVTSIEDKSKDKDADGE